MSTPEPDAAQVLRPTARVRRVLDRLDRTAVEREALRIGTLLARRRAALGISQRDLAAQCGTTQSAIARLESGGNPPRLSTLLRLAEALECDLVVDLRPRNPLGVPDDAEAAVELAAPRGRPTPAA